MATDTETRLEPRAIPLGEKRILVLAVADGRYSVAFYAEPRPYKIVRLPSPEQFHWLRNREMLPPSQITDWTRSYGQADTLDVAVKTALADWYEGAEWQAVVNYIRSIAWGAEL